MRLDINAWDYDLHGAPHDWLVTLDGVELHDVTAADDTEGWVDRLVPPEAGNPSAIDAPRVKREFGTVTIRNRTLPSSVKTLLPKSETTYAASTPIIHTGVRILRRRDYAPAGAYYCSVHDRTYSVDESVQGRCPECVGAYEQSLTNLLTLPWRLMRTTIARLRTFLTRHKKDLTSPWEYAKRRWPQLYLWDTIDDQTHVHHTVITVLVFGALGMLRDVWLDEPGLNMWGYSLAKGIVAGWIFYSVREVLNRLYVRYEWRTNQWFTRWDGKYKTWDGVMDVLVPVWITGPWTFVALTIGVQWWTGLVLYVVTAGVAVSYALLRPGYADETGGFVEVDE